jgi:hypothetical protein
MKRKMKLQLRGLTGREPGCENHEGHFTLMEKESGMSLDPHKHGSTSLTFCTLFFLSLSLFHFIYYADRNYSSSSLSSSLCTMVSIACGAATEDSADPELIVSFGVDG